MTIFSLAVDNITLLTRPSGQDMIYIEPADETQHEMFGDLYEFNRNASFHMSVPPGKGFQCLRVLGVQKAIHINVPKEGRAERRWIYLVGGGYVEGEPVESA